MSDATITFAVLIGIVAFFVWGRFPVEVVAIAAALVLAATGVLTIEPHRDGGRGLPVRRLLAPRAGHDGRVLRRGGLRRPAVLAVLMFGRRIAATLAATVLALAGCASGFQGHERFLDVAGGRLHLTVSPA